MNVTIESEFISKYISPGFGENRVNLSITLPLRCIQLLCLYVQRYFIVFLRRVIYCSSIIHYLVTNPHKGTNTERRGEKILIIFRVLNWFLFFYLINTNSVSFLSSPLPFVSFCFSFTRHHYIFFFW